MSIAPGIDRLIAAIGSGGVMLPEGRTATIDALWREAAKSDIDPGDRVAMTGLQGTALLRAVLGVWRSAGVPVLGTSAHNADESSARVRRWQAGATSHDAPLHEDVTLAVVHASSGSTGRPKLVRRSFEGLVAEAERYVDRYAFARGARAYIAAPIAHSFAFGAMLGLIAGGCVIEIAPTSNPRALARALLSVRYDVVVLTAPMARLAIVAAGDARRGASQMLVIAGAGVVPDRLDAEFREAFGCGLARNYGASETGATFGVPHALREGCIGAPFCGVRIVAPRPGEGEGELVLDLGHEVLGCEGEIASDDMQRGLWRTGDIVSVEDDGTVMLRGRIDDRVKINGRLVDAGAIAAKLRAMGGITDAIVLVVPRPERSEIQDLVAVCEAEPDGRGLDAREIAAIAGAPLIVLLLDRLLRTAAGKPDRAALLALAQERLHRLAPANLADGIAS